MTQEEKDLEAVRWEMVDLEVENAKLREAIKNIIDEWDTNQMSKLEERLIEAEELL